jgi:2'-5' RNA ligase
MRSFIAIDIPAGIKSSIDSVIRTVSGDARGILWVSTENIHLTLKFLGDVRDDLVPEIEKRLKLIGKRNQSFSVGIRGAGAFPSFRNPNVLWLGIEASDQLEALFREIDAVLAEIGFERESRKFSPHLTIGRVKDRRDVAPVARELSTYKDVFFGTIEVREILLMKSVLKPSGAEYSKTAIIELNIG